MERCIDLNANLNSVARLATGLAHDFNQLFSTIQGHASALLGSPHTTVREAESLRKIADATARAIELTRQLEVFGQKKPAQPEMQDLNEVGLRTVEKLQPLLSETIELLFEPADRLPGVECDPAKIERALTELCWNAVEAIKDGGLIRVATHVVLVDARHVVKHPEAHLGRYACLSVSDTGCGMDSGTIRRVLEPFFTTKTSSDKAGLGLSRVNGIAKLYQGWIEVSSQLGFGSTFVLYLPAASSETGMAPGATGPSERHQELPMNAAKGATE